MADQVLIELLIEQRKAIQELAKLNNNLKDTAKEAVKAGNAGTSAFNVFKGVLASTAITKGLSVITNGFKSLFQTFVVDGIKAAQNQEDAINRLNVALQASGIYSQQTSKDIQEFANKIQDTTKFEDDAVLETAALIQSLGNLSKDGLIKATQATLDLSAALKIDLNAAATLVGKAATGNTAAFARYGVEIRKGKDDTQTFANTLEAINRQFGGAAAGQVKTFSGAIAQASNAFGDLQETFGQIVTENPAVIAAIGDFKKIIVEIQKSLIDNKDQITEFLTGVGDSFVKITKAAVQATPAVVGFIAEIAKLTATSVSGGIGEQIASDEERQKILDAKFRVESLTKVVEKLQEQKLKALKGESSFFEVLFGRGDVKKIDAELSKALARIEESKAVIAALELQEVDNTQANVDKKKAINDEFVENQKSKEVEKFDFLKTLRDQQLELKNEEDAALLEYEKVKADERFAFIEENLGRERALKLIADVKALEDQKNFEGAKTAIRKASDDAQKNSLSSLFSFEKNTNAGRAANFKSTLNSIATLQSSSNKELFFIGKAAAIATATIDGIAGVQKAWALGPIIGPPLAALVGIATAVNLAKIASQQPPSFEQGGIVPGTSFSGDRVRANVNSGELILNQAQQDRIANKMGGGDIVIQIDGREIARAVRTQVKQGYALA